jgi:hypothetical protein
MQFGQTAQNSLVPFASPTNAAVALPSVTGQEEKRSAFTAQPQSNPSATIESQQQQTTNDILFLKRLLFIKASLDNIQ